MLTGFDLGRVLTTLGSPAQLGACSNESALKYLAEMWRHQRLAEEQQMTIDNAAAAAAARSQPRQSNGVYGGEGGVLMGGTDSGDNGNTLALADMQVAGVYRHAATDYNNYNSSNHQPVSNQYPHNNSQQQSTVATEASVNLPSSLSHPAAHIHYQNNNGSSGSSGDMVGVTNDDAATSSVYQHHPPHSHLTAGTGAGSGTMSPSSSSTPLLLQSSSTHTPRGADVVVDANSPHNGSANNGSPGSRRVTIMGMGGNSNSTSFGSGGSSQGGQSGGSSQAGRSGGSSRMSGGSGCPPREGMSFNGSADSGLSNGDIDTCYLSQGAVSLSREDLDDLFEGFSQEAMLKRFSFASACAESFTLNDHPDNTASYATDANTLLNSSSAALGTAGAMATQGCNVADEAEELFALLDTAMRSHPSIANVIDECCTTNQAQGSQGQGTQEGAVNQMIQLQHQQQLPHTAITHATPEASMYDSSMHSFNPQNPLNHPHLNFLSDSSNHNHHDGLPNGVGNNHNPHISSLGGLRQPGGVQGTYSNSDADLSRVIDSLGLASPLKNNNNNNNSLAYPEAALSIGMGLPGMAEAGQNGSTLPNMLMPQMSLPPQQGEGGSFVNDGFAPSSSSSTGMLPIAHASFGLRQSHQGQGLGQGLVPGPGLGPGLSLSGRAGHHLTSTTPSSSSSSSSSSSLSSSGSGIRSRATHHTSSRSSPRHQLRHHPHSQHPSHPSHHRSLISTSTSHAHAISMQSSSSDAAAGITATAFLWQPEMVSVHHPGFNAGTGRRPSFMQTAAALCADTFNPADLWELHQYYFSPPEPYLTYKSSSDEHMSVYIRSSASNGSLARDPHHSPSGSANQLGMTVLSRIRSRGSGDFLLSSSTSGGGGDGDAGTSSHRPRKRHGNRNTMARIATYPRIKRQLEVFKTAHNDHGTLKLLRLLRFVEESEEGAVLGAEESTEALVLELCENN